ncbi:MAG: 50S ribosomal protein L30 [Thermoanaerobacterales bacterium 50_218]|nr:MAG: 50S ribosomal protein L30 [Thermoanaerobacterales bacterium 50_218]HAA90114.1 50S ribosomal protein L30 [Peptococcaceae bacterium]
MSDLIRITLVRSPIGYSEKQRKILRALGLRKLNSSVVKKNVPEIQGMVSKVSHLVEVAPVNQQEGEV